MQEYLRLSDVYKMYGSASLPPRSSSPAALHCLSLAVAPALPCEVDTPACSLPHTLWHVFSLMASHPFPLSSLSVSLLALWMYVSLCVVLCEGVHHSQSVKPDLWDAESWSLLFLCLYCIIPTGLLWICLLMPLGCTWSFLLSLCAGLLVFPECPHECLSLSAWCSVTDPCTAPPPHLSFGWMLVIITSEPARAEQERNASY